MLRSSAGFLVKTEADVRDYEPFSAFFGHRSESL